MKLYLSMMYLGIVLCLACQSTSDDDTVIIPPPPPTPDSIEVRGVWVNQITVPPDPTATNRITFSGQQSNGTFVDQNNHSGTWTLEGDSITWVYIGVQGLDNTFSGNIDTSTQTMQGRNFGVWQGNTFEGTWVAVRE